MKQILTKKNMNPNSNANVNAVKSVKISEAAVILGVSESSIRRLIDRGIIKPSRVLRHLLVPLKQLDQILDGKGEEI
jgi:excisionase family DNA binding protein